MATELDQTYHSWPHQELLGQVDSQDAPIAPMLDQGSISFGRYSVESLAWEKRSVFTHNRCQEELEKLRAPGLVAQKKAYFEAYYKRIRALKALQANEQTELVVDYGGDDGSSCKTGEPEDETFEHGTLRNGVTNVAAGRLEEHAAETAAGVEASGALCCRYSNPESVVTCDFSKGNIKGDANSMNIHLNDDILRGPADSSTASFNKIDTDKNSVDSLQCGHLDSETSISYDDLWRTHIEDAGIRNNCNNPLQMGHLSKESTVLDSPRRMEEIELLKSLCSDDDEWNVKEARDAECYIGRGPRAEVNGADSPVLNSISELLPVDNHMTNEAKVLSDKRKSHSQTPRIKESVSSARKTKKTGCTSSTTKSEATKALQRPKHLLHKSNVLEEKKASASNAPSGRLPSKNNSTSNISFRPRKVHSSPMKTVIMGNKGKNTNLSHANGNRLPKEDNFVSVSSNRSLNGSSSNVATSRPLPFATQRKSTATSNISEIGARNSYSKSLNGSMYPSKQLPMQSPSVKGHAANGVKAAGLEKKSHHGEIRKTASVLHGQTVVPKARDGLLQRPEARSINLPSVSKYSLTGRTDTGIKGKRPKEGKTNARPRLYEGASKITAAPPARTNKTNPRKMQQVSTQTGSLLLDGKKSRQELKPWR